MGANRFIYFWGILLLGIISPGKLLAQLLPPLQPEQDCANAISVCQDTFFQPFSYQGEGLDPNEINFRMSCLGLGENNNVWYVFTIQQSGNLAFTITPVDPLDDYDWAVYDLSQYDCSDIRNNASLEISCNYSPTLGITGPNGLGNCVNSPNCPVVPVTAGRTYVINVSNWATPRSGYLLDFRASSAVLFDTIPPLMASVAAPCGDSVLKVAFSEPVQCATVSTSDFTVIGPGGPYTITAVDGANCNPNGGFEETYTLTISPPVQQNGWYRVALVDSVLDNCGNLALLGQDSAIVSIPDITLSTTLDTLCPGDTTELLAVIIPGLGPYTFQWNQPGISGLNPKISPQTSTLYALNITDVLSNCDVSRTQEIYVHPAPAPDFGLSPAQVCEGDSILMSSLVPPNPSATYTWDLGQGRQVSGSGSGPLQVIWDNPGADTVCLTTSFQGCISANNCLPILARSRPMANMIPINNTCFKHHSLNFSSNSSSGIQDFLWVFGDGQTASQAQITYQYSLAGSYQVQLQVSDSFGCRDTAFQQLDIYPSPVAGYIAASTCQRDSSHFLDTSLISPTGTIQSWQWDFGDGNTRSSQHPTHLYAQAGNYVGQLIVSSNMGCLDTVQKTVNVFPSPQAGFRFQSACEQDQTVRFTDTSSYQPPGLSWRWQFGDGDSSNIPNTSHVYGSADTFRVQMILSNAFGCVDTAIVFVPVWPKPLAAFQAQPACEGDSLLFIDQSLLPPPFSIASRNWRLGDGTSGNGDSLHHVYPGSGSFQARLITVSQEGCRDTVLQEVEVYAAPQADFSFLADCEGAPAQFMDQSIPAPGSGGRITQWEYDFGDGGTSTLANPTYIFQHAGTQTITLYVQSLEGCTDSLLREVNMHPQPEPLLSLADSLCKGDSAFLGVIPGAFTEKINWYTAQTGGQPFYEGVNWQAGPLNQSNTWYVEPVSDKGCLGDRQAISALLFPPQVGRIRVSDSLPELSEALLQFGIWGFQGAQRYQWDFGDGAHSDFREPEHRFESPGTYQVHLFLLDNNGCEAELLQNIIVNKQVTLFYPNAFSPNADGHNDTWYTPNQSLREVHIQIFNRWGESIFSAQNPDFEWDGTSSKGGTAPEGVYVFRLKAVDLEGKSFIQSGTITLFR